MRPTDEQVEAMRLFQSGESMVIDALAGTGKTSTLSLLAASTRRHGRYLAFNRAIVDDVAGRLPERCGASTAHSIAFRAYGKDYAHRLRAQRPKQWEVAHRLGIDPIVVSDGLPNEKRLAGGWLAGHVMRAIARFCNSADETPGIEHFPYADGIDMPDPQTGRRTYTNNRLVAVELEGALRKAWQDLTHRDGALRYTHDTYLKAWALTHPTIDADYVLLDEAQDTNPVLAAVIAEQHHAQRVLVGDEHQQLYEWRGAVDAMAGFDETHRRSLTRTWRFGPAIADLANELLDELDATHRIVPHDLASTVGEWRGRVDAVLCRTNGKAIETVLAAQTRDEPVHLVGGGKEVASFARAVQQLQTEGRTSHHELACFDSWQEVLDYVRDEGDSDMSLLVRLVERFGTETILRAVDGTQPEGPGVMTVSTGHKAKGRQWDVVRIADDFVDIDPSEPELRLRYVAFTRARLHLDHSAFRQVGEGAAKVRAEDREPV